jgi:hypothetical protein
MGSPSKQPGSFLKKGDKETHAHARVYRFPRCFLPPQTRKKCFRSREQAASPKDRLHEKSYPSTDGIDSFSLPKNLSESNGE